MGPSGVALGYVVEAWVIALAYAGYLARHRDLKYFDFFKLCGYQKEAIAGIYKSICSQSIPVSINMISEVLMEFIVSLLSGLVSLKSQAVMSYSLQFVYLLFVPLAAFGITSAQEVGREIGARNFSYASKLSFYSVIISLLFLTIPLASIIAYPVGLIDLFSGLVPTNRTDNSSDLSLAWLKYSELNDNTTLIDSNDVIARIMACAVFLDTIRYNVLSQLRAIGDPWISIILSNSGLIAGFVLSGILGLHTSLGEYGVASGYLAGVFFADIALIPRLYNLTRIEELKKVAHKLNNPPSCCLVISSFFCHCTKKRDEASLREPLLSNVKSQWNSG
jgi:Na+-driven multidrug efflux pump